MKQDVCTLVELGSTVIMTRCVVDNNLDLYEKYFEATTGESLIRSKAPCF